jgi:hypothetical protein
MAILPSSEFHAREGIVAPSLPENIVAVPGADPCDRRMPNRERDPDVEISAGARRALTC